MCYASPGPRCTAHVKKELDALVKEVIKLEDSDAPEQEIRKARRAVENKYRSYDTTPGGQKALKKQITEAEEQGLDGRKIRSLKNRLSTGENLRAAQMEAYEREQERRNRFEEIKQQVEKRNAEIAAGSPMTIGDMYPRDITNAMLDQDGYAYIQESNGNWGGPDIDYTGTAHLKECGVLATTDIDEDHTWHTWDTFNEDSHCGIKATTTCNCGQVLDAPLVGENMEIGTLITSMNKIR